MKCVSRVVIAVAVFTVVIAGTLSFLNLRKELSSGVDSNSDILLQPPTASTVSDSKCSSFFCAPVHLEPFSNRNSELRFLDVMLPYLTTNHLVSIVQADKRGTVRTPGTFTELAGLAELVGGILKSGRLMDFYEALKSASEEDPQNLNLLRMMVLVSSIQGFTDGEYEANLSKLVKLDTNSDVTFPYAQLLLEKGDAEASYSWIEKNVADHPDQAASTLSNALRIYLKAKAGQQKNRIVAQLKVVEVDPFQAHCCGKYLYEGGEFADAAFFYEKNASDEANPYYREAAQVRLCQMQIKDGSQDEKTVATLKELAAKSGTPAIQADARRALIELKVDLSNQRSNSSN